MGHRISDMIVLHLLLHCLQLPWAQLPPCPASQLHSADPAPNISHTTQVCLLVLEHVMSSELHVMWFPFLAYPSTFSHLILKHFHLKTHINYYLLFWIVQNLPTINTTNCFSKYYLFHSIVVICLSVSLSSSVSLLFIHSSNHSTQICWAPTIC